MTTNMTPKKVNGVLSISRMLHNSSLGTLVLGGGIAALAVWNYMHSTSGDWG